MRAAYLLSLLSIVASIQATSILLPLYWDPDNTTACYPQLTSTLQANPTLPLILILNPNNGPTSSPATTAQVTCLAQIKSIGKNVQAVGYVSTDYGKRSATAVKNDIATWSTVKGQGVTGVFLDETNNSADSSIQSLYSSYSSYIQSQFSGSSSIVILNPGQSVPSSFFSFATYIVTYESPLAGFTSLTPPSLSQQVLMVLGTNSSVDISLVDQYVPSIGAIYLTDRDINKEDVYANFGGDWSTLVSEVVKRNGGASASASATRGVISSPPKTTSTAITTATSARATTTSTTSSASKARTTTSVVTSTTCRVLLLSLFVLYWI